MEEKKFVNCEGEYGKYIMQELKLPATHATPEAKAIYEATGRKRIHWLDGENMPGCWQLNTSWYLARNREQLLGDDMKENVYTRWQTHVHDVDEILCFTGTDIDNPLDLCGELEIIIGDETHILTKSSLIFLPAGVPHSNPILNRVDRPIFHFSTILTGDYNFTGADGDKFETVEKK